jgi:hypothetical protein
VTRAARVGILLLVVVALLAGGCGSSHHGLPRQGLVVSTPKGVLLVGLDGRVLEKLAGYKLAPLTGDVILDAIVQREIGASYATSVRPVLLGPHGRVWQLVGTTLVPLARNVVPLPGGLEAVGRVTKHYSGGGVQIGLVVRDARTHRVVVPRSDESWFLNGDLLATKKVVTDVTTGETWRLPRGASWTQGVGESSCNPAGIENDRIVAICAAHNVVRVYSVAHDGRREPRGAPFHYGEFGAMAALLSPDGKHVAATLAVGCGLSPSIVAPVDGGAAHYVDGSSDAHPGKYTQSWVLGWTPSGKVVAGFAHGECEKVSPPAIDLVDPVTLKRTVVYPLPKGMLGDQLWSS